MPTQDRVGTLPIEPGQWVCTTPPRIAHYPESTLGPYNAPAWRVGKQARDTKPGASFAWATALLRLTPDAYSLTERIHCQGYEHDSSDLGTAGGGEVRQGARSSYEGHKIGSTERRARPATCSPCRPRSSVAQPRMGSDIENERTQRNETQANLVT